MCLSLFWKVVVVFFNCLQLSLSQATLAFGGHIAVYSDIPALMSLLQMFLYLR